MWPTHCATTRIVSEGAVRAARVRCMLSYLAEATGRLSNDPRGRDSTGRASERRLPSAVFEGPCEAPLGSPLGRIGTQYFLAEEETLELPRPHRPWRAESDPGPPVIYCACCGFFAQDAARKAVEAGRDEEAKR